MPIIMSISIAVAGIVAILTLLFTPIYSATTVLVIDSDLNKILGGMTTPPPAINNVDYIRYEFFASHSVQLMKLPQIAKKVIEDEGLKNRYGNPLHPEYLVHPNLARLVFNNNGLGVMVDWITDTQTFAITATAKDPDQAVRLSRKYSEVFLDENANQYVGVIEKLLDRTNIQCDEILAQLEGYDRQFKEIRTKYKTVEPADDIKLVVQKVYSVKAVLDGEQLKAARYQAEMDHLKKEEKNFAKLKKIEESFAVNPNIDSIKTEIRQLASTIAASGIEYTPDHPDYKQATKKLQTAKESLKSESLRRLAQVSEREHPMLDNITQSIFNLAYENVSSGIQIQFYTDLVSAYEARVVELSNAGYLLQDLSLHRDTLVSTLQQAFKDKYKLESVLKKRFPLFRVVSSADINRDNLGEYRFFPKRKRIVLLSAIVSVLVIFFFIIGRELKSNLLYFGWQLECEKKGIGCTDVPQMEDMDQRSRNALVCYRIQDLCTVVKDAPLLRITSGFAGEGRAAIALALAWYFQKIGSSCILVDGDATGQSVCKALGVKDCLGLIDVQAGRIALEDAVVEKAPGMAVLPPGRKDEKELITGGTSDLRETITRLNTIFTRVIYLEPPYMSEYEVSADTLPPHDVIMVAESGRHSLLAIDQAIAMRRFNSGGASLKWLVINRTPLVVDLLSPWDVLRSAVGRIRQLRSRF